MQAQLKLLDNKIIEKIDKLPTKPNPILLNFLKLNAWRPKKNNLKTKLLLAKIEQLSQKYQKEKNVIPVDIQKYLTQIQLIKTQYKDMGARLLKHLKLLELSLIEQQEYNLIHWPVEAPYNEIKDKKNIDTILTVITPQWLKENSSKFKDTFQQLSTNWQNRILKNCYETLPLDDYQKVFHNLSINTLASITGSTKSDDFRFFNMPLALLANLKFEAHRLFDLHKTLSHEQKRFDLLNMSMDLEKLASGMDIYHRQLNSTLPISEKQKIYQEAQEYFYHSYYKIQKFETKHPAILQKILPRLDELAPEAPFEMHGEKRTSKLLSDDTLINALKSKDKDKIAEVVEKIYQLSTSERLPIILACHDKLTSYIKDNPTKLYMLELERVTYQLQINNPKDPNIKVFQTLLTQLRANPEMALEHLTKAQMSYYKNLTWFQIVFGYYNGTGYGIGLIKDSMDSILENIHAHTTSSALMRKS